MDDKKYLNDQEIKPTFSRFVMSKWWLFLFPIAKGYQYDVTSKYMGLIIAYFLIPVLIGLYIWYRKNFLLGLLGFFIILIIQGQIVDFYTGY